MIIALQEPKTKHGEERPLKKATSVRSDSTDDSNESLQSIQRARELSVTNAVVPKYFDSEEGRAYLRQHPRSKNASSKGKVKGVHEEPTVDSITNQDHTMDHATVEEQASDQLPSAESAMEQPAQQDAPANTIKAKRQRVEHSKHEQVH